MINNLRWIGALGAVYVACAAVGTAQAAAPDDRAEARGPGAISAAPAPAPNLSACDGLAWDDAALSAVATVAVGRFGAGAGAAEIAPGPRASARSSGAAAWAVPTAAHAT